MSINATEPTFARRVEYLLRRGWVQFKGTLGLPIDVDKNFYAADAAWRIETGQLPKSVKFTVAGRSDGAGMQALSRISGLNFAAAYGATYVHTPFGYIEHQDRDIAAWVEAWETFFNFGRGEPSISDPKLEVVDYSEYFFGRRALTDTTVLRFQQCYWPGRCSPDSYMTILPHLREKVGVDFNAPRSARIDVALHVRRGDVSVGASAGRYTPNGPILTAAKLLREALDKLGAPYRLSLFSQGETKDFVEFVDLGCELQLNADALWTMQRLISADVLMMSKSSFSYTAGLINAGVKLYEPWVQPPLSDWIVRKPGGRFDVSALFRRLEQFDRPLGARR